ncbi:L-alanine exporter AlaE [Aestuariibacter sp. AA17]|uniref:L-alanine exporter AlaE n=1 Tax=Fluctibacter corallii TaxID=2984329 RepID=A0ABT3AAZ3_9ALTE|nr:L-alanine exporter AlaE [Aestuariibacter sp. AA17]MCV2885846.1 L-alanine exporter AlaE [Aestuariibacter sp. AA17]
MKRWREKFSEKWRVRFIDIWAMNSFSYAVALPIELVIAGMSWQEHVKVRAVALLLNTLVARPFGVWREFVFIKLGLSHHQHWFRLYLGDTLVFLSFQMPLYLGNMYLGGADSIEMLKAALTVSLIAGLLGRPYGMYLDWLTRKFLNTIPNVDKAVSQTSMVKS